MTVIRAELRKLLTLPSLRLTALLTWTAHALLTLVFANATANDGASGDAAALAPLRYTQAGFVILGVLAAGSEYQAGGQAATTLLAMPRRLPLQMAKVFALAVVTFPVAAATAATSAMPAGAASLAPVAAAYLCLTTLLAAALANLIRRVEAAAVLLLTVYCVAGPLLRDTSKATAAYLPDTAALDPSRGATATVVWTLTTVAIAAVSFDRRDA